MHFILKVHMYTSNAQAATFRFFLSFLRWCDVIIAFEFVPANQMLAGMLNPAYLHSDWLIEFSTEFK